MFFAHRQAGQPALRQAGMPAYAQKTPRVRVSQRHPRVKQSGAQTVFCGIIAGTL